MIPILKSMGSVFGCDDQADWDPNSEGSKTLRIIHVNDVYSVGHFSKLKGLCDVYRNENTILTHGGDFLSPYLLSSLDSGKGMIKCMNAVRYDIVCFGNHEADIKTKQLYKRIEESNFAWVNTNIPDLTLPDGNKLPKYCIKQIAGKKIGFIGVVTDEENLYVPTRFDKCKIYNPNETCKKASQALLEKGCDVVICLTHQDMADDRALAKMGVTNLILGGHEHNIFLENHNGCHIVKTGESMEYAAVVDIELSDPPRISTQFLRLDEFEPSPAVQKVVDSCTQILDVLQDVKLLDLGENNVLSAKGARQKPNKLGSLIATSWKEVLGVDIAFINGGGVRGKYEIRDVLTLNDINLTLPFKDKVEKVHIPGKILNDVIQSSRNLGDELENGGYLHCDKFVVFSKDGDIESVNFEKFDPERMYTLATRKYILDGGNDIQPLMKWIREAHPKRWESGIDIAITVNYFCDLFWLNIIKDFGFDGILMKSEIKEALRKKFEDDDIATPMVDIFFTAAGLQDDDTVNLAEVSRLVDFHSSNFNDILSGKRSEDQFNVLSKLTRQETNYDSAPEESKRFHMTGYYSHAVLPPVSRTGTVQTRNSFQFEN